MDEELPPPPEEPSNEETKLGGGSGEAAAGAAGGAAGGEETKAGEEKTEATAEAKASEGDAKGDEAPKEGDEKEEGQQADPTRWQDPSLWVIDQSQDRFQDKVRADLSVAPYVSSVSRACWAFSTRRSATRSSCSRTVSPRPKAPGT